MQDRPILDRPITDRPMTDRSIPKEDPRDARSPAVIGVILTSLLVLLLLIFSGRFQSDSKGLNLSPSQPNTESPATTGSTKPQ
jgi:hypothetical protein